MPPTRSNSRWLGGPRAGVAVAGLAVVVLVAGVAPGSGVAADDEAGLLLAAKAVATKRGLELCRYGTLALDKSESPGWYALLRDSRHPEHLRLKYALFQHTGKVWTVEVKQEGPALSYCLDGAPPATLPVRRDVATVQLNDIDEFRPSWTWVTFFGSELVVKSEDGMRRGEGSTDNWDKLTQISIAEGDVEAKEAAVVLLLPKNSPAAKSVPKTSTFLIHGRRHDQSDADLDVRAERDGGVVHLILTIADDKPVPLARSGVTDADFLKADHLEIWYETPAPNQGKRQLGIARLASGELHARWLHPRKSTAPVPIVSVLASDKVVVTFASSDLFGAGDFQPDTGHSIGFSAAFSDTDSPGKKQEALVATSKLKWGDPSTFGKLVWLENGARFPALRSASRIEVDVQARGSSR